MEEISGLIYQMLARINYCEFCGRPFSEGSPFKAYRIDEYRNLGRLDVSTNVIVLCPECKGKYDRGFAGLDFYKAATILREQDEKDWLAGLLERYDRDALEQSRLQLKAMERITYKLSNDRAFGRNIVFVGGMLMVIIGALLLACGNMGVNELGPGQGEGLLESGMAAYALYLFVELAGVFVALAGFFFVMVSSKKDGAL
jgi:hypothetical protein